MKKHLLLYIFAFNLFFSCTSKPKKEETATTETTYYLIRHSEKDRTDEKNRNPDLAKNGLKRAENWAKYFKNINLDAVYSTNYNRKRPVMVVSAFSISLSNFSCLSKHKRWISLCLNMLRGKGGKHFVQVVSVH